MKTKDMVLIPLFSALTVVCAWITVPSPIPFTLQTFAVLLSCGVLGGKRGAVSVLLYIALGAVGLPVFSGFRGGISVILGASGGYIFGFILSALFMWAAGKHIISSTARTAAAMGCAIFISYITGAIWYAFVYAGGVGSLPAILTATVVPFIIPDAAKLCLALYLTRRLKRFI